jgi:hypothetical protein
MNSLGLRSSRWELNYPGSKWPRCLEHHIESSISRRAEINLRVLAQIYGLFFFCSNTAVWKKGVALFSGS